MMIEMVDYQVKLIHFPSNHAKEMVTENDDGSYTIFIRADLSREEQRKAFCHAMRHILGEDFDKKEINSIESEAHCQ